MASCFGVFCGPFDQWFGIFGRLGHRFWMGGFHPHLRCPFATAVAYCFYLFFFCSRVCFFLVGASVERSKAKRVEWLLWRDRCVHSSVCVCVWGALLSACARESAYCMQAGFDGIEWVACCRKAMGSSSFSSLGGYLYNDQNSTPHPTNPAIPMIHSRVEQKCLIRLKN